MIFLDACAVIYQVETVAPWDERLRNTLAALRAGDPSLTVAVSDLSRMECRVQPIRVRNQALLAAYDAFFATPGLTIVPLSSEVVSLATMIRARSGLRTPDALQAACCISLGRPAWFVTSDKAFQRDPALDAVLI